MPKLIAYTDGASRGNPGPSAYGVVVYDEDGKELHRSGKALGHGTNNQAEYHGAVAALEAALGLGATELELRMDSELIVRQLQGRYRVKNPKLIPLHNRLLALRDRLDGFTPVHVPRAQNKVADALANEALDHASRG